VLLRFFLRLRQPSFCLFVKDFQLNPFRCHSFLTFVVSLRTIFIILLERQFWYTIFAWRHWWQCGFLGSNFACAEVICHFYWFGWTKSFSVIWDWCDMFSILNPLNALCIFPRDML
jgi:hypothetical protein